MSVKSIVGLISLAIVGALVSWMSYSSTKPPSNIEVVSTNIGKNEVKIATTSISIQSIPPAIAENISAWLWDSPDTFTRDELVKMFQIAQSSKITTIYLRMDDYAYIYGMKSGEEKTAKIKKLNDAARQFILLAGTYRIKVQALGGDTGWADPTERMYPNHFFDGVLQYNAENPDAQFVGIQFDVESHNSAFYKINKTKTLINYLDFVQEMVNKKPKTSTFSMGFAIPFWYDNQNNNGVVLDWRTYGSKPVAYHLFDMLNTTLGGYAVLMDYRNYAEGRDGSIENAKNEIEYVSQNDPHVKIIIGQETTEVSPSKITFYGTDKNYYNAETAKIVQTYRQYPEFAGIAIHHLQSYIDL